MVLWRLVSCLLAVTFALLFGGLDFFSPLNLPLIPGITMVSKDCFRGTPLCYVKNLIAKPHIQHAVGFIENKQLNIIEYGRAHVEVLNQSAGCGDDDVRVFSEQ